MTKKFFTYKASDDDFSGVNAWYRQCQVTHLPYIVVCTKTKFANVSWDYISLPPKTDKILDANSAEITDGLIALFKQYANNKSEYRLTCYVAEFSSIDMDKAESFAEAIFDFLLPFTSKITAATP